jgi:hypothetical protein
MQVILSNKSNLSKTSRVVITNNNNLGLVKFEKIAKLPPIGLEQLINVDATNKTNNAVLVYNDVVGKYLVETMPVVDGGFF